jgi:hypothetical protein
MRNFRCSHVAATLLYGFKNVSKTGIKCSWLKHPKSAKSKPTVTIAEVFPSHQSHFRLTWSTVLLFSDSDTSAVAFCKVVLDL